MANWSSTAPRSAKQSLTGITLSILTVMTWFGAKFQQSSIVPADMEYEEPPRGRVMFNARTKQFAFLADKCILADKGIVGKIISALSLPKTTKTGTDEHYKCSSCLPMK
jgi:hypothetical protein